MPDTLFISRDPLVDPARNIVAHGLRWQNAPDLWHDAQAWMPIVMAAMGRAEAGSTASPDHLVLPMTPATLQGAAQGPLAPSSMTFLISDTAALSADDARALRARGFGLAVYGPACNDELLPYLSRWELDGRAKDLRQQLMDVARRRTAGTRIALRHIDNWKHLETCAAAGIEVYAGSLLGGPVPEQEGGGLDATHSNILQLMHLVSEEADMRELELVLKREPAVSYRLLRYINSAGFGNGTEVTSLRHAVTMLGYRPLYRWLSILLASAGGGPNSPWLLRTAILRGRLVELLGQGFLPKREAENLFVAGMFTLLDRMLGMSMERILAKIPLPEALRQALLARSGIYAPFLQIAESCEQADGKSQAYARSVFITSDEVNTAHFAAIAWADRIARA